MHVLLALSGTILWLHRSPVLCLSPTYKVTVFLKIYGAFLLILSHLCLQFSVYFWIPVLCLAQTQPDNTNPSANTILIKDHQFNPLQLTVPAGQKLKITVDNQDPSAEEFES